MSNGEYTVTKTIQIKRHKNTLGGRGSSLESQNKHETTISRFVIHLPSASQKTQQCVLLGTSQDVCQLSSAHELLLGRMLLLLLVLECFCSGMRD